jgi:hypothetical protein
MDGKDKPAERPGESDLQAKKGALPPDKTAPNIIVDKAENSNNTFVSEKATLIDDNMMTSTSDIEFAPQPGGLTLTPATHDIRSLASVTPPSVLADGSTAVIGSLQNPLESAAGSLDPKAKKDYKQSLQIEKVASAGFR